MNAAQIAQLAIILAPIAEQIIVEGDKIITTYRSNMQQSDIDKALELSRSANWPQLTFGLDDGTPH